MRLLGQASVEFLMLLSLLSLIFVISVSYFLGYSVATNSYLAEENYRSICRQVSDEIEYALSSGPRYERSFYLPQGDYNASIGNYEVSVRHGSGTVVCYTFTNASADLSIGKNTIIYNETGIWFE